MDSIKKILIIEDNKDIRTVLARRMSSLGFETLMAEDGITGLEKARSGWPDVIILDLTLPKMSGQEVCKAIREDHNKEFARIPIIMLTGKTDEVDRVIGTLPMPGIEAALRHMLAL